MGSLTIMKFHFNIIQYRVALRRGFLAPAPTGAMKRASKIAHALGQFGESTVSVRTGKMKLAGMWTAPGSHTAGWRMPGSVEGTAYTFRHTADIAQICERGKMDCLFFADSNLMQNSDLLEKRDIAMERQSAPARLEAMSVITALAAVTSNIGLIATATTTYNEPYNIARRFATIDQISGGRGGWNLVTSQHVREAMNYGLEDHMEHDERYARAEEFFDVCAGLWDGWEYGAIVEDKANARYSDMSKFHMLDHAGRYFKVKGPLNVPRSPQGRPIIAQAGASGPGRDLAARIADMVFLASSDMADCKAFADDVRARAEKFGRKPSDFTVTPGFVPVVGRTEAEAREHYLELQSQITDEQAIGAIRHLSGGLDLSKFPLDGPLPDLPPTNGPQARQKILIETARRENFTLREAGRWFAQSFGHNVVWGSPEMIADFMEEWFRKEACDGYCILFPYYRRGVTDFVDLVIPELQRRGLFRTEYEGSTLRENLGLPVPKSIYA